MRADRVLPPRRPESNLGGMTTAIPTSKTVDERYVAAPQASAAAHALFG
jgi:hypothetical protein